MGRESLVTLFTLGSGDIVLCHLGDSLPALGHEG